MENENIIKSNIDIIGNIHSFESMGVLTDPVYVLLFFFRDVV